MALLSIFRTIQVSLPSRHVDMSNNRLRVTSGYRYGIGVMRVVLFFVAVKYFVARRFPRSHVDVVSSDAAAYFDLLHRHVVTNTDCVGGHVGVTLCKQSKRNI